MSDTSHASHSQPSSSQSSAPNKSNDPFVPLKVEPLIRRMFEENRQIVNEKDPIFTVASICRAAAEVFDSLLKEHNAAIDEAMVQRIELFRHHFSEELRRLRDETLSSELKAALSDMLQISKQSSDNLKEMQRLFERFEEVSQANLKAAKKNRIFQLISTSIAALSFIGATAVFILILK